jgi:hypothetical protein
MRADYPRGACKAILSSKLFALFFALIYAFTLANLPLMQFRDRINYLTYASGSFVILQRYLESGGWVTLFMSEPLWLLINIGLSRFLQPEDVLRVIIFLPAFIVSYLALRSNPPDAIWIALFLLIPGVLKNHIVHLRQGLAIAIFLVGWFARHRGLCVVCFLAAPFIHVGFFATLGLMALAHATKRLRFAPDLRLIAFVGVGVLLGVSLPWIGDLYPITRQASEYDLRLISGSGLGFLFWGSIFLLMLLQPRYYLEEHAFEIGTILFYLMLYPLVAISARVFENTILLVLLAGLRLSNPNRKFFLTGVLIFAMAVWGKAVLGAGPVWLIE